MSLEVGICQISYWKKASSFLGLLGLFGGGGLCRNSQPWKWIEGVSNLKFGSIVGRLHIGVEGNLSPMPSSLSESISNPSVSEII